MSGRGRKIVCDRVFVVPITNTAAAIVVSRIFRRRVVASPLPPYQAARKQQPITPALARSLSRKNATMLSNSHDRPATLLIAIRSWSFKLISQLPRDRKISRDKTIQVPQNSSVLRNGEMAVFARELAGLLASRRRKSPFDT